MAPRRGCAIGGGENAGRFGSGFAASQSPLAAELEQQKQSEAFTSKVTSGEATMPEIVEGLKKFPKAAPAIATYFARNRFKRRRIVARVRRGAVGARTLARSASTGDRTRAINARQRLANAMQKIAPELPKPIFTVNGHDCHHADNAGPGSASRSRSLPKSFGRAQIGRMARENRLRMIFDVSPDQMRRLLAAMKDADAPTYDALVAKVKEIDPHFFDTGLVRQ